MSLLSVVIPSYNEEGNIKRTSEVISGILENASINYELIFVSDGSKDGTYAAICEQAKANPKVKGIEFSRNFGKEAAIFAGLGQAKGDVVAVLDCDLQHPAEKLVDMYKLWEEGYEVIEGVKSKRGKEGLIHKMFVGIFYGIMSSLMKIDMNSTSDYKMLDRKVVDVLLGLKEKNTFFRALTFWAGFKSIRLEYEVQDRTIGKSKWSFAGLCRYAISNTTSFTTVPLKLVSTLGWASILCSIIVGVDTLYNFFAGKAADGFTTVILLLLLIGGCIMISLGIIGHYIGRIYEEVKGRPTYIISNRTDNM